MRCFRFHLGTLVILVLLLGVNFAALRESNDIWDSSIFNITLGVLSISILLAIHRTEKRRAFWLGFALFGSAYLGLTLVPSIESRLITTKALAFLDYKIRTSIAASNAGFDLIVQGSQPKVIYFDKDNGRFEDITSAAGSNTAFVLNSLVGSKGTTENFIQIGHSLLALIAAFVGGLLSRHLYAKNGEADSGPVNPQA